MMTGEEQHLVSGAGLSPAQQLSFGPVPSRRLGRSLGINNIPAKTCTYCCVYCQVGLTTQTRNDRQVFYKPAELVQDVRRRLEAARRAEETVDYLTFVPDGEPTLDLNLGEEINLLRELDVPIGVITNSTLLWRDDVREELAKADWVSLKVDTVQETVWRKINRPKGIFRLAPILEGMLDFAKEFKGELVTETMLVKDLNDSREGVGQVGDFLRELCPSRSWLSIPTRPPAENWVRCPDEGSLNQAYQLLASKVEQVHFLIDYEGDAFAVTDAVERDLLGITAVHPMRESAVRSLLTRAGSPWALVDRLLSEGALVRTQYDGHIFYLRKQLKK